MKRIILLSVVFLSGCQYLNGLASLGSLYGVYQREVLTDMAREIGDTVADNSRRLKRIELLLKEKEK